MGRMFAKKQGVTSAKNAKAQRENLALGRQRAYLRFGGRLASAEQVKHALAEHVSEYLEALHALARDSDEPRVQLDAARYLIDRVAGRPTERQQVEQVPVTYQAPSEEQFRELAGQIRMRPNGESAGGEGVLDSGDARTQAQGGDSPRDG